MKVFRPQPPPSADSSPAALSKWADQIAKCAISCARTIEVRKIRANEVPLVIGALVKGFCDHTGLPLETALEMVRRTASSNELPEVSPSAGEVA